MGGQSILDHRHGGVTLLHRTHKVDEVSGRRVSKAGGKWLLPGTGDLSMQIAEKWQLPPFRLGMCTARRVSKLGTHGAHRANPARALTRGRDLTRGRGGARCATGKKGGFPLTILKPRAEGYETEILGNLAFRGPVNHVTCMRKPQALNALTVWVFASDETRARQLTAAKLHGTSPREEQSSTEAVAEVQMDDRRR